MNYSDDQLRLALAKMLPEKLVYEWNCFMWHEDITPKRYVLNTEWLHVCWLVEQDLIRLANKSSEYFMWLWEICLCAKRLGPFSPEPKSIQAYLPELFIITNASWQQRAIALAKVKGVEIV